MCVWGGVKAGLKTRQHKDKKPMARQALVAGLHAPFRRVSGVNTSPEKAWAWSGWLSQGWLGFCYLQISQLEKLPGCAHGSHWVSAGALLSASIVSLNESLGLSFSE